MDAPLPGNAQRRDRTITALALAMLTLAAWTYLMWLASAMNMDMRVAGATMVNMPAHAWTMTEFGLTFLMWAVMMIGMMTPSATPMILIYARVARQAKSRGQPLTATSFFSAGYLLAWVAFSLAATIGQWALQRGLLLSPMLTSASPLFSASVLIAAGIFQWTPVKQACLRRCQTPWNLIQQHGGFRQGPSGAVALGLRHGMYCIGCCWALMALLFVGGVMNLLWIAVISAIVLAEKILPANRWFPQLTGAVLVAWGAGVLTQAIAAA